MTRIPPPARAGLALRGCLLGMAVLLGAAVLVWGFLVWRTQPVPAHPFFTGLPDRPHVIAHRGSDSLWPENTIHAFEAALELGADIVELDLRTTADGVIVVLHDATVDRTTDGTGPVAAMTLERLRELDAAYHFSPPGQTGFPERGRGHTIPTLDEVLASLPGARLNLEMKEPGDALATALCDRLRAHGAGERVLVASFHGSAVRAFRRHCPEVATSATSGEAARFLLASLLPAQAYVPSAQALQLPERFRGIPVITPRTIGRARAANLPVHAFTINDPARMGRLLDTGVDGLVTDRPDLARERIAAYVPRL